MEFVVSCRFEKQNIELRTNALRAFCSAVGVECVVWKDGELGDCLCGFDTKDSFFSYYKAR